MSFLEIENLTAFYGDFQALFGINMSIEKGETVAAIGANGAGKSTFLRSITGLVQSSANKFLYDGETLTGKAAADIVGLGIAMVPEGRRLFPSLSVEENLIVGSYSQRPGNWTLERVYKMFPKLEQRRDGGEEARALAPSSCLLVPL